MLMKNLISKLEKAGWTYTAPTATRACYQARKPDNVYCIEWHQNGAGSLEAECLKVRKLTDESDSMTDYHAGTYADSIKLALNWAQRWNENFIKDQAAMKEAQRKAHVVIMDCRR